MGSRLAIAAAVVVLAGCDLSSLETYDGGAAAPDGDPRDGDTIVDGMIVRADGGDAEIEQPDTGEEEDSGVAPAAKDPIFIEALAEFQTTSDVFVDVPGTELSLVRSDSAAVWVIFASGRIRAETDIDDAFEVALNVDGVNVDRFNHKTTGNSENWAGFLTFYPITGDVRTHVIKLQLRATVGRPAAIADARLVAAPMPENADFRSIALEEETKTSGLDVPLLSLDFSPAFNDDYYIFARLEQSARPGSFTARTAFRSDPGYANTSAAFQPVFYALRRTFSTNPQTLTLRGFSSGTAAASDWWDFDYQGAIPVTIETASSSLPEQYAIAATLDHEKLVMNGESSIDGRDIRVIYDNGATHVEVPYGLDPDSTWGQPNTKIWFPLIDPIPEQAVELGYRIYYSATQRPPPIENPAAPYLFFDEFDNAMLDSAKWTTTGASVDPQTDTAIVLEDTWMKGTTPYPAGTIIEGKVQIVSPFNVFSDAVILASSESEDPVLQRVAFDVFAGATVGLTRTGPLNQSALPVGVMMPELFHIYGVARSPSEASFYLDDQLLFTLTNNVPVIDLLPLLRADTDVTLTIDWVRVRPWVPDPPIITIGSPIGYQGQAESTWRGIRIMTFRAGAFDRDFYNEATVAQSTSEAPVRVRNTESTANGPPRDYLVIQTARISGDADPDVRRNGVLRLRGQTVMETSHKIDSDASDFGYHHTAGFAGVVRTGAQFTAENGYRSPDGITVEIAESVIIILRYPN